MDARQVTLKGHPLTIFGLKLKLGAKAPDFTVSDAALQPVKLSGFKGRVVIINAVPSVDTPVCNEQIKRFNREAATIGGAVILSVSVDLPFALNRYCAAEGIDAVIAASDHRKLDFGIKYSLVIEELRLLARAVFVVGKDGNLRHVEYVDELDDSPDFERALAAARSA